jgi:hypothetical protein
MVEPEHKVPNERAMEARTGLHDRGGGVIDAQPASATAAAPNAGAAAATAKYRPTPDERASMNAYFERQKRAAPAPRVTLIPGDKSVELSTEHADPHIGVSLLMNAVGTSDQVFFEGLLSGLVNACSSPTAGQCLDRSGSAGKVRPLIHVRCGFDAGPRGRSAAQVPTCIWKGPITVRRIG